MHENIVKQVDWEKVASQLPAVVQDRHSGQVLMLGYMNQAALQQTVATGKVTFYSRTKQRLWVKGETSGNYLWLHDLCLDCDGDTLLVLATPAGPACHQGTTTCFARNYESPWQVLSQLEDKIARRQAERPPGSYVTSLFEAGTRRITQKVGEEAVEAVIASIAGDREELRNELADMLFHTLVMLADQNMGLEEVLEVLKKRRR